MKIQPRIGRAAFTLIELMAVITIIVILAGLVVGGMGFVGERQDKEKAKVQIKLIEKALEEYKTDMGMYPPTDDSEDGREQTVDCIYAALFYDGYDYGKQATPPENWTKATRIFLPELDPTNGKQGWMDQSFAKQTTPPLPSKLPPATTVVDPWGNEYRYRSATNAEGKANTNTQNPDFDLWSCGKDGVTKPLTPGDKANKDDIKNF